MWPRLIYVSVSVSFLTVFEKGHVLRFIKMTMYIYDVHVYRGILIFKTFVFGPGKNCDKHIQQKRKKWQKGHNSDKISLLVSIASLPILPRITSSFL